MRPVRMRNFGGGSGGFPGLEAMSARLTVGLVAGSVLFLATRSPLLLLVPTAVLGNFFLWQPLTYAFIEVSPLGIIFGGIILWSIGGWLEASWGSRRLLWVVVGTTAGAGLLTALLSLLVPLEGAYPGGTVMVTVVWVAYGLAIGRGQTNFWGIPLSGNAFAGLGAGFVLLKMLTAGWRSQVPDLFGLVLIYAYVKGASPKRLWLQLQHWRIQRQLRQRSRHLHVVGRGEERPQKDRYLN